MPNKKLSEYEVNVRFSKMNVKGLDIYVSSKISIRFECLKCKYIWKTVPNNIFNGRSCAKCAGVAKSSNEEIDLKLNNKIKRIDNYIGALKPINFQCLNNNCKYIWKARPSDVLRGSGCPKCNGRMKLSNKEVDNRLFNKSIIRIDNFISTSTPINFQCKECFHIWKTCPHHIFNNTGCPICANKYSNEEIDVKLIDKKIIRMENYVGMAVRMNFQCQKCNFQWKTRPGDIFYNKSGCPKCNCRKNEKEILQILIDNKCNFVYQQKLQKINYLLPNFKVDFYFPKINLIIEYNGLQHYKLVRFGGISEELAEINFIKQKNRDKILRETCIINNFNLLEIDGRKYFGPKLKKYLLNNILPKFNLIESTIIN